MEYKVKTRLTTMVLLALMAFGSVQASDAVSEKDNFYQAVNGKTLAAQICCAANVLALPA